MDENLTGKHQRNVKKGTLVQKRSRFKISNSIESFLDRCIIGWQKLALTIELGSLAKNRTELNIVSHHSKQIEIAHVCM